MWSAHRYRLIPSFIGRLRCGPGPGACSVVVAVYLEGGEPMIDVGVADEEVEADSGTALTEHVVGRGDHLHAVNESPDVMAGDCGLHDVAIPDPVLRTDKLPQRREVPDFTVPPHDLGIGIVRLEASEENLVPGAGGPAARPRID